MKAILVLICCVYSLTSAAQIEKKTFLIGGNGSVNIVPDFGYHLSLNPQLGYFVKTRLVLGAGVGAYMYMYNRGTNNEFSSRGISPLLYCRYYVPISQKTYFFAQSEVGFDLHRLSAGGPANNFSGNLRFRTSGGRSINFDVPVVAGFAVFLNENVTLDAILRYHFFETNSDPNNGFTANFTRTLPVLNLGFQVYLRPKEKE